MANDKDFILKNAIEVGGSTKVTIGDAPASGSYAVGYTDASLWAIQVKVLALLHKRQTLLGLPLSQMAQRCILLVEQMTPFTSTVFQPHGMFRHLRMTAFHF